jgi:tRNA A37 N6-isopentenylltransferase MiaA
MKLSGCQSHNTTTKKLPFDVSEKEKKTNNYKALTFLLAKDNTALTTCFRHLVYYHTSSELKFEVMALLRYNNYSVYNFVVR